LRCVYEKSIRHERNHRYLSHRGGYVALDLVYDREYLFDHIVVTIFID